MTGCGLTHSKSYNMGHVPIILQAACWKIQRNQIKPVQHAHTPTPTQPPHPPRVCYGQGIFEDVL